MTNGLLSALGLCFIFIIAYLLLFVILVWVMAVITERDFWEVAEDVSKKDINNNQIC